MDEVSKRREREGGRRKTKKQKKKAKHPRRVLPGHLRTFLLLFSSLSLFCFTIQFVFNWMYHSKYSYLFLGFFFAFMLYSFDRILQGRYVTVWLLRDHFRSAPASCPLWMILGHSPSTVFGLHVSRLLDYRLSYDRVARNLEKGGGNTGCFWRCHTIRSAASVQKQPRGCRS